MSRPGTITSTGEGPDLEDLESFRARARAFVRANLKPADPDTMVGPLRNERTDEEELEAVAREREVQRLLFDAGLAGICFPKEYGGQGLTRDHQRSPQPGADRLRVPVPAPGPHLLTLCRRPVGLRHRGAEAGPHPGHLEG